MKFGYFNMDNNKKKKNESVFTEEEEEAMKDFVCNFKMKISDKLRIAFIESILKNESPPSFDDSIDRIMKDQIEIVLKIYTGKVETLENKIKNMKLQRERAKAEKKKNGLEKGILNLTNQKNMTELKKKSIESLDRKTVFIYLRSLFCELLKDVPILWRSIFLENMDSVGVCIEGAKVSGDEYENQVFYALYRSLKDYTHLKVLQNVLISSNQIRDGMKSELDVIVRFFFFFFNLFETLLFSCLFLTNLQIQLLSFSHQIIDTELCEIVTLVEVKRSYVSITSGLRNIPQFEEGTKFDLGEKKGKTYLIQKKKGTYSFSRDLHVVGVGFLIDKDKVDTQIRRYLEEIFISHLVRRGAFFERVEYEKDSKTVSCRGEVNPDVFRFHKHSQNCWVYCGDDNVEEKEEDGKDEDEKEEEEKDSHTTTVARVNYSLSNSGFLKRPIKIPSDLARKMTIEMVVANALGSLASRKKMREILENMYM